ncbi:hypothetical protein DH2020_009668 [Rehmannia glutinosa]|uniref:Exostosin GT47 domain-containing protein n=1 Tax=Rehmannia glutinosa TaxID=99300 RepID=A0ABR0X7J0_REHGL
MAGRHHSSATAAPKSQRSLLLLFTLSLIFLSLLFYIFTSSSSSPSSPTLHPSTIHAARNPNVDYSFVPSLEKFLTKYKSKSSSTVPDDTVRGNVTEQDVKIFDDLISHGEEKRLYGDGNPFNSPIRVYVYDMPSKFTYDLLWLFHNSYRETTNLTSNGSPVHRLIEQHSIDYWLWADLIAPEPERLLKNVVRVHKQEEADLFYIPFFTTISFFLLEKQQCKALYREALKWVMDQPAWKRSEGRDHILPVHHPWSFKSVRKFMKNAIWLLPDMDSTGNWSVSALSFSSEPNVVLNCRHITADIQLFWQFRYKPGQVYLEKDLILPYVANVDLCDSKCSLDSKRTTLLFFRGRLKRNAGGKIRARLVAELNGAEDVVIEEGTAGEGGKAAAQIGMRK